MPPGEVHKARAASTGALPSGEVRRLPTLIVSSGHRIQAGQGEDDASALG